VTRSGKFGEPTIASMPASRIRSRTLSRARAEAQVMPWPAVRAPAPMATKVLARLPTTRNQPKSPLRMLAGPCAINSWFGSMLPPLGGRDESCHPAHSQGSEQQENSANQDRKARCERIERCRSSCCGVWTNH
jgi:hypothetical protein